MKKPMMPKEALARLQDLCSRSEQCTGDIAKKLYTWGVSSANSAKIIELLQRDRFVDDSRFAAAYTRDKYRFSGWGKQKIARMLAAKRIDRHTISAALDEIDIEEYEELALKALKAKARTLKEGNTYEGRTKLFRFGVTRGYEVSLVSDIIKHGSLWD
ncbi:MAG: RecX family transcriptional regulator [Muribaculaceae bacterium]|jgi:regulatory protein|nr:RecX family transcriptional regulator [Muribaculaceae bacterium]